MEDQITIGASENVPHKQTGETGAAFCKRTQDARVYKMTAEDTSEELVRFVRQKGRQDSRPRP